MFKETVALNGGRADGDRPERRAAVEVNPEKQPEALLATSRYPAAVYSVSARSLLFRQRKSLLTRQRPSLLFRSSTCSWELSERIALHREPPGYPEGLPLRSRAALDLAERRHPRGSEFYQPAL